MSAGLGGWEAGLLAALSHGALLYNDHGKVYTVLAISYDLCIGTCGEAVSRSQPITCIDVAKDDRWSQEWRELCVAHGVLAYHSEPVTGIEHHLAKPVEPSALVTVISQLLLDWVVCSMNKSLKVPQKWGI